MGPQVTYNCCLIRLQIRGTHDTPPASLINLLEWLTELMETLT